MVEVTCDTRTCCIAARVKKTNEKSNCTTTKNDDYYDGNLWALKWSKSMIALAVNDYTIKKKNCNLKVPLFRILYYSTSCVIYSVSSKI